MSAQRQGRASALALAATVPAAALIGLAAVPAAAWTGRAAVPAAAWTGRAASPAALEAASPPQSLASVLRDGGVVLYFRHTHTLEGKDGEPVSVRDDCRGKRNLSERGRAEASAIGAELERLRLPIGEVLASPFCRTLETAQLIFGRATPSFDLRSAPGRHADRHAALRRLLSTPVPAGRVLALTAHGVQFEALAGGPPLVEGEAAVLRPRQDRGFDVVGRITPAQWRLLR